MQVCDKASVRPYLRRHNPQHLPALAKERVTFSDMLAMVRRWLWAEQHLQLSQTEADMMKVPRAFFERLTETLCYTAYMDKVELSIERMGRDASWRHLPTDRDWR